MSGPLTGVKVVELAGLGALPFGTLKLADMGADVIRVDRAGEVPAAPPDPPKGFSEWDRGRRSIGVDLKHPDGVEVVLRLAEQADALLESFRPGVAERLGVGPDAALARNPKLVYGRLTGWGQDGPLAQTRGTLAQLRVDHRCDRVGGCARRRRRCRCSRCSATSPVAVCTSPTASCARCSRRSVPARARWSTRRWSTAWRRSSRSFYGMARSGMHTEDIGTNLFDGGSPFYSVYETADAKYVTLAPIEPHFYAQLLEQLGIAGDDLPAQYDQSQLARDEGAHRRRGAHEDARRVGGAARGHRRVLRAGVPLRRGARASAQRARELFVPTPDGGRQVAPAPRFSRTKAEPRRLLRLPGRRHRRGARRVRVRRPRGARLRDAGAIA